LPGHLKGTGVRNLYFKIVYPEVVRRQLAFLMGMGLSKDAPVTVDGSRISPRQFVTALAHQSATAPLGAPADFEVMRVKISGTRQGRPLVKTWDCELRATRLLTAGAMGVGFAGAVAAEMLALERTTAPAGAAAPEGMLDSGAFFKELVRRKVFRFKETIAHPLPM
jgi:saccharopine dehydrogenase-like NADP-dependent oxidoreductase